MWILRFLWRSALRRLFSGLLHHVVSIVRAGISLLMEAASISETSVNFYQTTRCNNPEDSHFIGQLRPVVWYSVNYWSGQLLLITEFMALFTLISTLVYHYYPLSKDLYPQNTKIMRLFSSSRCCVCVSTWRHPRGHGQYRFLIWLNQSCSRNMHLTARSYQDTVGSTVFRHSMARGLKTTQGTLLRSRVFTSGIVLTAW
jgi:hypothetical protein